MWLAFLSCLVIGGGWAHSPILLTDVKTLTLKAGHQTASRRGPPVPQLECVGGNCKEGKEYVEVMQCTNKGTDASGIPQWECKAELPANWRLGTTDVSCEGYLNADDPYILAGSCGVEYTLHGPAAKAPAPRPQPQPQRVVEHVYHAPAPAPAPRPAPASSADSVPFSWAGLAAGVVSIATVVLVVAAFTICIMLCIGLCSWIDSYTPRVSPRIRTVPVAPAVPVYPTVPVATPLYPTYPMAQPAGYSNVVCTSAGVSDFATGYVMGHASAAQPAAVYHAPPCPRTPSPPRHRRSPSPEPAPKHTAYISTGYGTTKRR